MHRTCSVMLIGLAWGAAYPAVSGATDEPPRRQMHDCMSRRMASDRLLSYNQAARTCKELLQKPATVATAGNTQPPKTTGAPRSLTP